MLQAVRRGLKGIVAWFVIVLLVLAFAAFGVPELREFTRRDAIRVGEVGYSSIVVQDEFNRFVTNRRVESGGAFTREDAIAAGVPAQIVSTLATRAALEQEARRLGLAMPREVVREFLRNDANFINPRTGKFDNEILTNILQQYGLTARGFEQLIRSDLLRNQLVSAAIAGGPAPLPLVERIAMREIETRSVAYLTVTDEMAGIPAEPTREDLRIFFNDNPSMFTVPEQRIFTVVNLQEADMREGLSIDEAQLRRVFDANRSLYETPERRTLYQLTLPSENEAAVALSELRAGKPFEAIALARGLSLAAVTYTDVTKKDLLEPKVAEAAFSDDLSPGDIVGPVNGLFGSTVLQLVDIQPVQSRSFEETRAEIETQMLASETRKRLFEAVENLETARDSGATLVSAAKSLGLKQQTHGPVDALSFGPDGQIIGGIAPEALREAFRLDEGDESDAIEVADKSGYIFVSLQTVIPPAVLDFDEVIDEVQQRWRQNERDQRIGSAVRQIREAVADGETLESAAALFNRTPIVQSLDRRYDGDIFSAALVEQIFTADKGAIVSGAAALGASRIIAEVREISHDFNRFNPTELAGFAQYIGLQMDQELLDAYASALRSDFGVKVDQAQIDSIFDATQ